MIIELTETWGVRITICTNPETVCDNYDLDPWEAEATQEALSAAQAVITDWTPGSEAAETDSFYPHWHGGEHYNATYRVRSGLVVAELYHREPEAQDADDLVYGDWEWMGRKETPQILQDGLDKLVDDAADAMFSALDVFQAELDQQREKAEAE